ncbi:MAG: hypothetical protein NVSMB18_24310 [Acetobacteraceae bacterium]
MNFDIRRALAGVTLVALMLTATAWAQAAERRIALVIGIAAYKNAPQLANPVADARAMAQALRGLNFEVDELYDANNRTLSRAIRDFGLKAQKTEVAVVFYAGHGVQAARDNYLIPEDARLERERDLLYEAVPLDLMLGEVSQASKLGIVLLDACRDNPFVERIARTTPTTASAGLARVANVPRNMLVAMSTKSDAVAEDGSGEHSPFATALLEALRTPGLELSLFFRKVRDSVLQATSGRQEPYVFSSLGAEPFYFKPSPVVRAPVVEAVRRVRMYTGPIGMTPPTDVEGGKLQVSVKAVPRGVVRNGTMAIRPGSQLTPEQLGGLTFLPEPGYTGSAGLLAYEVRNEKGGVAESAVEIDVIDQAEAADTLAEAALWERVRGTGRAEDLDLFLRLYPQSRFAPAAAALMAKLAPTEPAAAQTASISPPARGMAPPSPSSEFKDCPTCPVMVNIPLGAFTMGLGGRDPAAKPAHHVNVRAFALSQEPITSRQWQACANAGACSPPPEVATADPAGPVHNMSWDDAQAYVRWLSATTGKSYRLPSEAEWEYAARGGTTTRYPWGDQLGVALANCANCGGSQDKQAPAPARNYKPNAFGLYGMGGGVAQWVQDCWFPSYAGAPTDGAARQAPNCRQRVIRGGSFRSTADDILPWSRNAYDPPVRYFTNGFRVARDAALSE